MILGIIQARMSSTRLPCKVLMPLCGKPMLHHQIERVQRAKLIDKLVVATSSNAEDDAIADGCPVPCYRGSLDDVLDRFFDVALVERPHHIVRLTGDCPLSDPGVIDAVIACHLEGGYDYTSNVDAYIDGLDVEIFTFQVLSDMWAEAKEPDDREHVTRYIRDHPDKFNIGKLPGSNMRHIHLSVDTQADFDLIRKIYQKLYPHNHKFTTRECLQFLESLKPY